MTEQDVEVAEADEVGEPAHEQHVEDSAEAHHPRPSAYVGIAAILALVTAGEIGLYYVSDVADWIVTLTLLVMMAVKFFLVAMWFMHLRFETPIFRRLFYGGLALAVIAYSVFLSASHVFPLFV